MNDVRLYNIPPPPPAPRQDLILNLSPNSSWPSAICSCKCYKLGYMVSLYSAVHTRTYTRTHTRRPHEHTHTHISPFHTIGMTASP